MCGITGFIESNPERSDGELRTIAAAMAARIAHRGPDDSGVWSDSSRGVCFGHRRLAVIDLSAGGAQPMVSASGRYVLTYNGEVYNHRELRRQLDGEGTGVAWRGHSDTEVLLEAIEHWGLKEALERVRGMFAFSLWDRRDQVLVLARDRMGEKPLYYGFSGGAFLFGSELSALRQHPDWRGEIDRDAVALLLRHNCIPAPHSIYQGIAKLPPATLLKLSLDDLPRRRLQLERYWSIEPPALWGSAVDMGETEAVDILEQLLDETVEGQMISDVPLGAFLSGGIDSSLVVAAMQKQSSTAIKTFTIGFSEPGYDESAHAAAVARHLGTDHTELTVTPEEALAVIPEIPRIYDEPFADSSQIPAYLVSRLTRTHVTVSLSGDGGDELFAGYSRYVLGDAVWRRARHIPHLARRAIGASIGLLSPGQWDRLYRRIEFLLPGKWRQELPGMKLAKLGSLLPERDRESMYLRLASHWRDPDPVVIGGSIPLGPSGQSTGPTASDSFVESMMYCDMIGYLPDDILVKVDRAAMAVSLESRMPLIDHKVTEYAISLPLRFKLRDGTGKWLLRSLLDRYVPQNLTERPKMGFSVPLDFWLRGPLREWAAELLDEKRLRREGFLKPEPIIEAWRKHQSGRRDMQYHLWDILMFQAWLEAQGATGGP